MVKRTQAQQVAEIAMDARIKQEPYSQHSYSIDLMDDIEQTPTRRAHHKKFKVSQGKDSEETIKTMQEQIDEDLGVDMNKWKQFCNIDIKGINQEAMKYRLTGNENPIKIQQEKTNIEKGEQYGDAMTALSASQSTALTANAKALEGN
ncbi:MAG: hypothetical protein EZS28_044362, partial [Streblomastix strix]